MIAAIDFDGTLVEHMYPQIGAEVEGAFEWLDRLQSAGVKLILWTMRDGGTLAEAVEFCAERGIVFWGVNSNPGQHTWSASPKQYAHVYVDDAAAGCPLRTRPGSRRAFVDWAAAGPMVWAALGLPVAEPGGVS